MKTQVYILQHIGLGDAIMTNAITRHYCKIYDIVFLFVKKRCLDDVSYMFRDLLNLKFLVINSDEYNRQFEEVNSYLRFNKNTDYIEIGYNYLNNTNLPADRAFYKQVGLDFQKRYDDFYLERDLIEEQKVYDYYNPNNEPYVFLHHDTQRTTINKDLIKNKTIKLIEINFKLNEPKLFRLFHYRKLIENCEEGHFIDSSFKCFADSVIENKENMYFHIIDPVKNNTTCRSYWNIVKYK